MDCGLANLEGLAQALIIVQPETVIKWHRQGFRMYWRWKSRSSQVGRPKLDKEIRDLIQRISDENPLWGVPRIQSELRLLGYEIAELKADIILYKASFDCSNVSIAENLSLFVQVLRLPLSVVVDENPEHAESWDSLCAFHAHMITSADLNGFHSAIIPVRALPSLRRQVGFGSIYPCRRHPSFHIRI